MTGGCYWRMYFYWVKDKQLLYLFPSLIPLSLAQSPELNDWGNCSRRPYNSTLFNWCNLGSRIYSLRCNSQFIWMWITLMQRWVHTTLSFWWIFITIIQLTNSFWLSFSLPSFNPLILVEYPSSQDSNLSIDECKRLCVKQHGHGITFEFQFGPDIENNVNKACIFFSNLVEHPLDMMFWISNRQSGTRMTMLKQLVRNHKYVITKLRYLTPSVFNL